MRKFIAISIILLLNVCCFGVYSYAKDKDLARVEQERKMDSFDKIHIEGPFNVVLIQGNTHKVKISAKKYEGEYVFNHVKTKVKNGELFIDFKEKRHVRISESRDEGLSISSEKRYRNRDIDVYISFENISRIKDDGIGKLSTQNQINADELSVKIEGVGSADLNLKVDKLVLSSGGVGNVKLTGSVREADVKNSGVSNIDSYDCEVENMDLDSSGVGSVKVNVSKDLKIDASGMGSVRYRGNPTVSKLNVSGIGSVKKAD